MRFSAIIRTILSMQVLAVCLLVGATFSSTYSPEEYQGPVEHNNTSVKLSEFAHQPSELDPISLSAPLFRNDILGAAWFETDRSFKLDARAGGCQCSGLSNECCTPTASSEAPFCMPTGSTCCPNAYCVETESCCGDGGCCPAITCQNTTCYTKSNGPGCCPNGSSCSGPATCYDYTSSNCSDITTPSPQCCPPDLPFCNYSDQAGYGCYATSAPAPSSTSSTKPSTTIPKSDLTTTTTTSSSTQTRSTKTITVAAISNPTGGLNLKFPFPSLFPIPKLTTEEEGEVTKYILSNGAALSLENNPSSPQTGIASFIITGTINPSPTSSNPTTISSKPTTPVISASSSPPISPPPTNSITTTQTTGTAAEFPLATTISTSQSSPILAPFRLIRDHPHVFIFIYTFWIILLMEEGFSSNLLNILIAPWIVGNFVYSMFFHNVPIPTPPAAGTLAREGDSEAGSAEEIENVRKKRWLHFLWWLFYYKVPVATPPAAESEEEQEASSEDEIEARVDDEIQLLQSWRLERLERSIETRERRVELQKCILERLERRRDSVDRELERVQWREAMGRMVEAMRSSGR
ncbi:hypothetical protein JMJ35_009133 [Cladonia borealis]|uniref:GPI anchored protein n=1 Tax=Cladonia borealis TaxID=184061 RepID=A0AA39UYR8_9LECA|nr:hypothetical protein JMJ35_009133 [Cladonia borealis]